MQRIDAQQEASKQATLHGGTWYALEKQHNFHVVRADQYHDKLGRIVGKYQVPAIREPQPIRI